MVRYILTICLVLSVASCSGGRYSSVSKEGYFKIGKPYQIENTWYYPEENTSYVELGKASWYGPQFHGKLTANGGVFNQYEVTAAHRTLPIPSIVRVDNLENGKSLIVKVNDRGPYAKGRIIDLSRRSAELLGTINRGVAQVRVTYLPKETEALYQQLGITRAQRQKERIKVAELKRAHQKLYAPVVQGIAVKPIEVTSQDIVQPTVTSTEEETVTTVTPAAIQTSDPISQAGVFIQAGAFGHKKNAEALAQRLLTFGAAMVSPLKMNEAILYRVRLGPFKNQLDAESVLTHLASNGFSDATLVID